MILDVDDPHRLAEIFLRAHTSDGVLALHYWNQSWYSWNVAKYIELEDEQIRCEINKSCEDEFNRIAAEQFANIDPSKPAPKKLKVTSALVSNVYLAVKTKCLIPGFVNAPRWIGGPLDGDDSKSYIAVLNGIIDIRSLTEDGEVTLIPHSPNYFNLSCIPVKYSKSAECPTWDAFLEKNLELHIEDNVDKMSMLREWFGYCLTPDVSRQKFLMMEGEGRNGKSVICAALRAMLGQSNVSHVTLEAFSDRFSLGATVGKLANIAAEVGELDRVAEGHLKAFTSGDRMTIDRKFKEPINVMPTARLVLATNNRPRFSDKSSGIYRRMLLLPLTYQVPDDERVYGMDTAEFWQSEKPGIFNWALTGLADLQKFGRFTESEASKQALEEYRTEANPAREFIKENFEFTNEDGDFVNSSDAYQHYRKWCEAVGNSPMSMGNFGKEIFRLWPEAKKRKLGNSLGGRFWAWSKIRKLDEQAVEPQFEDFEEYGT